VAERIEAARLCLVPLPEESPLSLPN